MKKTLLLLAFTGLAVCTSCGGDEKTQKEETFAVSLEITGIQDNCATIKAALSDGSFYGAKMIEMMNADDVAIDYTKDIPLTTFIRENGVDVTLPFEKTLTDIRIGADKFTAIMVFDETGRAAATAYQIWTPEGSPAGWSTDNNPGTLEEINW